MGFSLAKLFGGQGFDYGAQARDFAQALERQNQINAGMQNINATFAPFNDAFFDKRRQEMLNFYQPQIDQQFNDAQKQLVYALARSGGSQSSAAAQQRAALEQKAMTARQNIVSQADSSTQDMRNQIESARAGLVALLNSSGDAATTADQARSRVAALSTPQTYGALPDLFGTAAGIAGQQKGLEDAWNASNGLTTRPSYFVFGQNMVKDPSKPTGASLQPTGAVQYS
jgi:hypothetical protein